MTENGHVYEAKVWQYREGWKAKVLRDGIAWSLETDHESRDAALEWAKLSVEEMREAALAEKQAERVAL
jgi:hypothetical protein